MKNDTIYRQAAIKHLKHRLYETAMNNPDLSGVFAEIAYNRVNIWIEELPSADPEIVRCNDCFYYALMPNGCNGQCDLQDSQIMYPWDFCSYGERRPLPDHHKGEEDE